MATLVLFMEALLRKNQDDIQKGKVLKESKQDWDQHSKLPRKRFKTEEIAFSNKHHYRMGSRLAYKQEDQPWEIAECCIWP
ncbi:hypothetical protein FRX31_011510 [Thalictrum thalictroides]|uniref:Uncharacterized protein n=1 Tax=Thalictrum thalictroides TaxID=46969 RepID=A0A7J6WS10_THATH|nr:hypothetical protein FRX31_011510 [Thalictrum thalictroides]